ncbi:hypothetical protein ES703_31197 [subsurface metagenome]
MVKGDWPDDFLNARVARCITWKCIDVVALVDGMCWVIEVKPIAMARTITGNSAVQEHHRQLRSPGTSPVAPQSRNITGSSSSSAVFRGIIKAASSLLCSAREDYGQERNPCFWAAIEYERKFDF